MATTASRDSRLEVICAGWGRTGTLSLKMALDMLGYPCYHMSECFKHKGHAEQWMQLAAAAESGQPLDFSHLLSGYTAITDWPGVYFYNQLIEQHPEAKVVLTVRDADKWYTSTKETVWEMSKAVRDVPWYVAAALKVLNPGYSLPMVDQLVWEGDLQGCFESDPRKVKQLFQQHIEEVKKIVPADRLLVYEVSQGWTPLCELLGQPVPNKPFPHANERQEWRQMVAFVSRMNAALAYGIPAVGVLSAAAVIAAAKRWL